MGPNFGLASLETIFQAKSCATTWAWIRLLSGSPSRWRWSASSAASWTRRRFGFCRASVMSAACRASPAGRLTRGIGDLLAEGSQRAASASARATRRSAVCHARQGLEMVSSSRERKPIWPWATPPRPSALATISASTTGIRREVGWTPPGQSRALGILERVPMGELSERQGAELPGVERRLVGRPRLGPVIFASAPTGAA